MRNSKNIESYNDIAQFAYVQGSCTDGKSMYYILERKGKISAASNDREQLDHLIIKVQRGKVGSSNNYVWYVEKDLVVQVCWQKDRTDYENDYEFNKACYEHNKRRFGHGGDLTYVPDLLVKNTDGTITKGAVLCIDNDGVWAIAPKNVVIINKDKIIFSGQYDKNNKKERKEKGENTDCNYNMCGIAYYCNSDSTLRRFALAYTANDPNSLGKSSGKIFGIYKMKRNLTTPITENSEYIIVERMWHFTISGGLAEAMNVAQGISCDARYIYAARTCFLEWFEGDSYRKLGLLNDKEKGKYNDDKRRNVVIMYNWKGEYCNHFYLVDRINLYTDVAKETKSEDSCKYFEIEGVYIVQNSETIYFYTPFIKSAEKPNTKRFAVTKRVAIDKKLLT